MEKFIPYEKLSKKQKRALDAARRGSWGGLSPVTRRAENPKAYQRKKARIEEEPDRAFFMTGGRGVRAADNGSHYTGSGRTRDTSPCLYYVLFHVSPADRFFFRFSSSFL